MAADSGRLREACVSAHTGSGTRSIQVIACLSVLLTGFWHGDPAHKYFSANPAWQDCLEPVSNRSLVDAPAGLRHGNPAHKYLSAILAWQDCLEPVSNRSLADAPAGLRHGTPVHRCLCGIPAWRSGLQSTLRHSDPTHRYFRGIYAWQDHLLSTLLSRDPRPQVLQSHLPVAKQSSIGSFVHEMGPFCGRRGLDRVFLHEMGPFCGRRGPE